MEYCEVCNKEKTYKKHDFKLEVLKGLSLGTDVYNCNCPQVILTELLYLRDNNIQVSDTNRSILIRLKKQKLDWFYSYEDRLERLREILIDETEVLDHLDMYFVKAMKKDVRREKGKEENTNPYYDEETVHINKRIWRLIYECEKEN